MPTTVQVSYYTVTVSKSRMFEPYIIGYDESVFPPVAIYQDDVVIPKTTLSGDANSYTATGLEPDTAYYFLLTACNRAGCQSMIYGPVITHRVITAETATFTANARYNPLTGLVRFWWTQEVYPYHIQIVCSASGGTKTFDVYGKLYTEETLLPGWNTVTIQQFTEDGLGTDPCVFTLYVPASSAIGAPQDILEILESTASINQSIDVMALDIFVFQDLATMPTTPPLVFDVLDSIELKESISTEGAFVICEAGSSLIVCDDMTIPVNGYIYVEIDNAIQVYDYIVMGDSATITIEYNDHYAIEDSSYIRVSRDPIVAEESVLFMEAEHPREPCFSTTVDTLNFMDTIASRESSISKYEDKVIFRDVAHGPEINTKTVTEVITPIESTYGFQVGDTYDFTHVQGGQNG